MREKYFEIKLIIPNKSRLNFAHVSENADKITLSEKYATILFSRSIYYAKFGEYFYIKIISHVFLSDIMLYFSSVYNRERVYVHFINILTSYLN